MLLPCHCHVTAMLLPCHCHVIAMSLPRYCHVVAVVLPWCCHATAVLLPRHLPCHCHALAMSLPCLCHVVATSLPCRCHVVAMSLPSRCHAIAMQSPWRLPYCSRGATIVMSACWWCQCSLWRLRRECQLAPMPWAVQDIITTPWVLASKFCPRRRSVSSPRAGVARPKVCAQVVGKSRVAEAVSALPACHA